MRCSKSPAAERIAAWMVSSGYLHWARRIWPGVTDAEVLRALKISDEVFTVDRMMRDLG
jgi:hypothetical protein